MFYTWLHDGLPLTLALVLLPGPLVELEAIERERGKECVHLCVYERERKYVLYLAT